MDSAPVLVAVAPAAPHHTPHHITSANSAAAHLQSALINKSASIAALSPLALKKFHNNHILKTTGGCLSPKATRKSSAHSTPKKVVTIVNNNYAMSNHSSGHQEMESLDDMLRKVVIIILSLCYVLCVPDIAINTYIRHSIYHWFPKASATALNRLFTLYNVYIKYHPFSMVMRLCHA